MSLKKKKSLKLDSTHFLDSDSDSDCSSFEKTTHFDFDLRKQKQNCFHPNHLSLTQTKIVVVVVVVVVVVASFGSNYFHSNWIDLNPSFDFGFDFDFDFVANSAIRFLVGGCSVHSFAKSCLKCLRFAFVAFDNFFANFGFGFGLDCYYCN